MPPATASTNNILHRLRRNRRGTAAIEFALVAPIFFAVLFAILELALTFFASQMLETVTQDSARLIMTGRAQDAKYDSEQFKVEVCKRLVEMFDCANGITIDVRSYPSFAGVNIAEPIDATKAFIRDQKYCPGKQGDVVMVRLFYQWPVFVTGLGFDLRNLANGKRLLTSTAAFQNEPFTPVGDTCS